MALSIGTIKQMSGLVMAKNSQGDERVLKVGDTVFFEDNIRTIGGGSHIVLALNDGQEIVLDGNDALFLDKSVYVSEAFGEEAVVAGKTMDNVVSGKSVEELQAALLAGKDINELQPTAAGEGGAPIGGEMSTNAMARYVTGGNESNVTADYRTLGATGGSDVTYTAPTGVVAPTVVTVNSAPLGSDLEVSTNEDQSIVGTLPIAIDADNDSVTYVLGDGTTNGSVVVNPDGTYTYIPNENYNGPDSFTYTISDGNGGENTYTVFINVVPVNDPAILSSATETLHETNDVLSTGGILSVADVDEGEAAYVPQTNVSGTYGTFSIGADGTWSYVAHESYDSLNAGDTISDTFNVTSVDGTPSSVQVTIIGTNDAAILSSATETLHETNDVLSTGGILSVADVDEGEAAYVPQTNVSGTYGTFSIGADGTWSYVAHESYDSLNAGDTISDTFNVTSVDGTPSSVTVNIIGTNDGPMAESKVFTTAEDTAITITDAQLLANATDIDSHDILSVNNVTLVDNANGTLIDNHNGTYTFVPSANYSGSAIELMFTVTDSAGMTDTQDVTINVTPVADAPLLDVSIAQGDVTISPEYPAPVFNGHLNAGSTTGNIVFDGYTKTAAIDIKSYKTDVDDGRIVFLRDGIVVKEVLIDTLLPDANNTPVHLELSADEYFNTVRIDNFATSSDKNAEFKIDSVSLISDIAVEYNINIAAALTDSSETLSQVLIDQSTLPMDAVVYENGVIQSATDGYYSVDPDATVTFTTDHYMSVDEINAVTSSVTSQDGTDYATTTQTALNEISGTTGDDGLYGSTGDDLMDGDSGNDALYGDSGDDYLDGGIGTDSLYGEADNDTLTYDGDDNIADGGSGTDTLLIQDATMDFSAIDDAKIENIEVLDLTKSNVSISNLNPNDVFDITDDANTVLRIVGESNDSVASTFVAGESPWEALVDQTGVDDGFTRYEGTLDDGVTKVMVDIQNTIVHTDFD